MDVLDQLKKTVKAAASKSSLYAVANESGVDYAVLHRWLTGERSVSGETVNKLARHFGMELKKR